MKRAPLLLFIFLSWASLRAQSGYNIKFQIKGLRDTTAYLGYYYWENTFVIDTAKVNDKGEFAFTGDKPLTPGVFILVMDKKSVVEFPVDKVQNFSMATDTTNLVDDMKVTGNNDVALFFDNLAYIGNLRNEAKPYVDVLRDSTITDEDKKKEAKEAYDKISQQATAHQVDLINKYPTTLTARLLNATRPITVPDPPTNADGSIDSTFQLRYYREHFFDNFPLTDEALLRIPPPGLKDKIDEYLDKLYTPDPDTLMKAIDGIVEKAKSDPEMVKFIVYTCLSKYENPKIMGTDAVFMKIYDKYFATGEMDYWANDKLKSNLKEAADRIRESLVGHTGANLILQDANGKMKSMYDLKNKYVILYIFDPDCGHCRKETPKLVNFFNHTKFDVGVYAVSADSSLTKMKNYITEMGMQKFTTVCYYYTATGHYQKLYDAIETPSLYVLDRNHTIIGKKVPSDDLEKFLTDYEIVQQRKLAAAQKTP